MGRRMFVGSVVAGLPLIAGAGVGAFAQSRGAGRGGGAGAPEAVHDHAGTGVDAVYDHLFREMAAVHNRMRREIRGEDARAFAAHLRTLTVYSRQQDLDTQVKAAVRAAIDQEGRQALALREPDANAMRAGLTRYGFAIDDRVQPPAPGLDVRRRAAAFDTLASQGITGLWERIAMHLEQVAPEIDRRNGTIVRVALARQDAEWWAGFCASLRDDYDEAALAAVAVCALVAIPLVGVIFELSCVATGSGAATLAAMLFVLC